MTSEARIHGDEQLAFGLAQAALELERMNTADRAVATLVFTAASGRVPVKTGRLPSRRGIQGIDLTAADARYVRLEVDSTWAASTDSARYKRLRIDEAWMSRSR